MVRDFQQLVPRKSPVFHTSTETLKVTSTCFRHVGVLSVIWTGYWWCLLANVGRTPFLYCCLHKFTNPNQQNHRKYEQMYLVSRTSGKVNSSEKPEISLLVLYRMPFYFRPVFLVTNGIIPENITLKQISETPQTIQYCYTLYLSVSSGLSQYAIDINRHKKNTFWGQ